MKITKDDALRIAREECERRQWPWDDEVYIQSGFFHYRVWIGALRGAHVGVVIRKRDGHITESGFIAY